MRKDVLIRGRIVHCRVLIQFIKERKDTDKEKEKVVTREEGKEG